jgi:hypothetical protein
MVRYCDDCPVWDMCQGIALRLVRNKTHCEQRCMTFDVEAVLASPMPDPFLEEDFRMRLVELRRLHEPNRACLPGET